MSAEPDPSRVDELRQQLRALGYLDAGLDRFVLGAARQQRKPSTIAALASLRIGALGTLLMGPAAATALAVRMPDLVTGPRDALVVALYTGVLFGAGVSLAALAAILLVWSLARRSERPRRAAAVGAGVLVTAASVAYLTLWWNASGGAVPADTSRTVPTIVALGLAAAISVLIGHTVTVAALGVILARSASVPHRSAVPGSSWRVLAAAAVLTFAGALLLFNLTAKSAAGQEVPSQLTVISSGLRIRLVAIDGLDPDHAKRLADAGRIPALGAALGLVPGNGLRQMPVARATVQLGDTRDPARVWTTLATGRDPDAHAVRAVETRRVLGMQGALDSGGSPLARALAAASDLVRLTRPAIVSGDERRVKTLWEVTSDAGLRTAAVNWWATWPAPAGRGIVVSDRAILRLERGGDLDAEIAPPALYEALRARWPDLRRGAANEASRVEGPPEMEVLLHRSAELDALQLAIARQAAPPDLDLLCLYLPGLDLVQYGLLGAGGLAGSSASAVTARLNALDTYYVFLDRLLESALAPASDEMLMVLTSPGRVQAGVAGTFALAGGPANPRVRDAVARPADVAPTVLYALGVPISRELPGRALIELFAAEYARRYPIRTVGSYGAPAVHRAPRGANPLDKEMIERLRSLGYIQ